MDKQIFLDHIKTFVKKTDGYYYVMNAKNFILVLQMEKALKYNVIKPHEGANISDIDLWKSKLTKLTAKNIALHNDLYVVLVKHPTGRGVLRNFVFEAFIFNGIVKEKVSELRATLKEDPKKGLFRSFSEISEMSKNRISPYYSRLVPTLPQHATKGMWVLKKFY